MPWWLALQARFRKLHRPTARRGPRYRAVAHDDIAAISRLVRRAAARGRSGIALPAGRRPRRDIAQSLTVISPRYHRVLSFPVCAGAEAPRYRAPASSQPRVVVAPSEDSRCWAASTAGHLRARCRARPIVPPPRLGRSRAQFGTAHRNTPRRARCHRIHRNPMAAEACKRSRHAGMPPDYVPLASAVLAGAELRRATGKPKAAP